MIVCSSCGRENADNFNFCLDCGTELSAAPPIAAEPEPPVELKKPKEAAPRASVAAPKTAPAPAQTGKMASRTSPPAAPKAAAPAAELVACAGCGAMNAKGMKFCGQCGGRLDGAASQAPQEGAGAGKTMFLHAAGVTALAQPKARLITIDQSGKEGMTFNLSSKETTCGRVNGTILFFDDPFVSPSHCTFVFDQGKLTVRDEGSLNGVFVRVRADHQLADGDLLRMGRQLFKLEISGGAHASYLEASAGDDAQIWGSPDPGSWGRLIQILSNGTGGEVYLLRGDECRVGRELGDILIPTDGFISASHCAVGLRDGAVVIRDLGSSNGTYVRLRQPRELGNDDFILIGNQMLKVEIR